MITWKAKVNSLVCLAAVLFSPSVWASEADDAKKHALILIAPQGNWVVQVESRQVSFDHQYDQSGSKQALGSGFDNLSLDGSVFPALAGTPFTLGTTNFSSHVTSNRTRLTLGYGLTDDITIGMVGEYVENQSNINFSVTGGNVGFNPLFDATVPASATNSPFAPVSAGVPAAGTEGVQQILTSPAFGYEYKRIASVKTSGLSDTILGFLYRVYEDEKQSFVLGGGYRFGMAKADDPDNLFDVVLFDGNDDVLMQAEYLGRLGSGFDVQVRVVRTWQLEDQRTMRVPTVPKGFATLASKEVLTRNLGDYWEYDIGMGKIFGEWRVATGWHRSVKGADSYASKIGTNTTALSAYTDKSADQWLLSMSWSGIDAWQAGAIFMPVIIKLEVQETYKAKNMPDTFDVHLSAVSFF